MKKHKELRDDGRLDSKRCLWRGTELVFPYKENGATDYIRAKCPTFRSNIFRFGKTQYKSLTLAEFMNRKNKESNINA